MKGFEEALKDGFVHVTEITDPELLRSLRADGVQIDAEGYHSFYFGDKKEFELRFEPILEDGMYYVALYLRNVLLTEKIPVRALKRVDLDRM